MAANAAETMNFISLSFLVRHPDQAPLDSQRCWVEMTYFKEQFLPAKAFRYKQKTSLQWQKVYHISMILSRGKAIIEHKKCSEIVSLFFLWYNTCANTNLTYCLLNLSFLRKQESKFRIHGFGSPIRSGMTILGQSAKFRIHGFGSPIRSGMTNSIKTYGSRIGTTISFGRTAV